MTLDIHVATCGLVNLLLLLLLLLREVNRLQGLKGVSDSILPGFAKFYEIGIALLEFTAAIQNEIVFAVSGDFKRWSDCDI